jgi:hypothetical protein
LLLTGHSHFDHSFDTAAWSRLTGAPIVGSKTTCLQVGAAYSREAMHVCLRRREDRRRRRSDHACRPVEP